MSNPWPPSQQPPSNQAWPPQAPPGTAPLGRSAPEPVSISSYGPPPSKVTPAIVLIVVALDPGPQRFGALASRVGGISQRMLTQTLRSLERDGFVTRTAYPEIPPRVEYALTPLGRSLLGPLRALEEWAVTNLPAVASHQQGYAAAAAD